MFWYIIYNISLVWACEEGEMMGYTILDLIEKMILIEEKVCSMYREMALFLKHSGMKVVCEVLAREEERHIQYYKVFKGQLLQEDVVEIDFYIYDKVSFLLDSFKYRLEKPKAENTLELIKFALELEKENLALLLDIQGRLVQKEADTKTITYRALNDIIEEERSHVGNLEKFLKN
jgi:rubrerythrin